MRYIVVGSDRIINPLNSLNINKIVYRVNQNDFNNEFIKKIKYNLDDILIIEIFNNKKINLLSALKCKIYIIGYIIPNIDRNILDNCEWLKSCIKERECVNMKLQTSLKDNMTFIDINKIFNYENAKNIMFKQINDPLDYSLNQYNNKYFKDIGKNIINNNIPPFIVLTTQRSRSSYFIDILKNNIIGRFNNYGEIGQDYRLWEHLDLKYDIRYSQLNVPFLYNYNENDLFNKMINNDFLKVMYNQININSLLDKKIKIIHLIRDSNEVALSDYKARKTGIYHYYQKDNNNYFNISIDMNAVSDLKNIVDKNHMKFNNFLKDNNIDHINIDANNIDWKLIEKYLNCNIFTKETKFLKL